VAGFVGRTGAAEPAAAQGAPAEAETAQPPPGIVRIVSRAEGGTAFGSGTVVAHQDTATVVLTCAHLFVGEKPEVVIVIPDGAHRNALLVGVDRENDLGLLVVPRLDVPAIPIAKRLPRLGTTLGSCGFGQEGTVRINRGEHLGYATLQGGTRQGILELAGLARQGDSGGPILNDRNELVAVIMGSDGSTVDGSHCRPIRRLLNTHPVTAEHLDQLAKLDERAISRRLRTVKATMTGAVEELVETVRIVRLTGRVLCDGMPVAGAEVRLTGAVERTYTLDAQGTFVVEDVPPGRYRIGIETQVGDEVRGTRRIVHLEPTRQGQQVELELE